MSCRHGTKSPTFGYELTGIGKLSITSTRISVPGNSMATRVALVTPLLITNSPSDPRLTSNGCIPCVDFPCWAICRCNLNRSAPDRRDHGNRSNRGSTSRKTRGFIHSHYQNFGLWKSACLRSPLTLQHRKEILAAPGAFEPDVFDEVALLPEPESAKEAAGSGVVGVGCG